MNRVVQGWFNAIHSVILLLSPRLRDEGDCRSRRVRLADGEESESLYFDHPFGQRTREESYQRHSTALGRERAWVLPQTMASTGDLPCEGVVPERPVAPHQVAGTMPASRSAFLGWRRPDAVSPVRMGSPDVAVVSPLSDVLKLFLELAGATNQRPLLFVKLQRHC